MGPRERGRRGEDATLRLVQDNAADLLRFARRYSLCADDAQDAYQRGVEILVRRMRTAPPDSPLNWLRTVIRNEAASVRRERERLVGREEVDFDREEAPTVADPADRVAGFERLGHVAEALQRLKSQEVTALVLRAEGLSYEEICTRTGWTYTKTNRAITEGRRALLDRLRAIESGAECERWLPQLSLLADGEATAREVAELRPHLRGCAACRATLRHFHDAPSEVAALVPVALVPLVAADPGTLLGHAEAIVHALTDRATFAAARLQSALDALPGTKVAAVAASTAALAGGGAAIEHVTHTSPHAHAGPATTTLSASAGAAGGVQLITTSAPGWSTAAAHSTAREAMGSAGEFGVESTSPTVHGEFEPESPPAAAAASVITAASPVASTKAAPVSSPQSHPKPPWPTATAPPSARPQPPAEFAGP